MDISRDTRAAVTLSPAAAAPGTGDNRRDPNLSLGGAAAVTPALPEGF